MLCLFRSLRVAAASPTSGLPNPLLRPASVCEPDSVFSVSFPEGRERSRRPSLSGRRLRFVAVGHFAHFGARYLCFITRKTMEGWEASNCCSNQLYLLRTPCLPSAIPERFAGGLSCQGMTIRLTGCGLCQGSSSTIASNPADTPQALWTRGRRLNRSEDLIDGQPVFHSLPPIVKRRQRKRSVSEQRSPEQWFPPSADSRIEIPIAAIEIDLPVVQIDQNSMATPTGVDEMIHQMQETMRAMQQDATRRDEFAKQQAEIMAQQAELITRLQQQNAASASHQIPPPAGAPLPGQTPTIQNAPPNIQNAMPSIQNLQEDRNLPTGPAPPPLPTQLSKTPATNHPDSPFEFEVDHTALKLSKLEKLFKMSQGVKAIPDIGDEYTDVTVMLPDRFKMPQIDRFDGSGDPMVHLRLFSDILRPMGLTRPQKLSLFSRTLSGVAATWYAKLEDEVKKNWDEMAEAFVAQYSYNTQIEITTRDLETTRQEPKEAFSDFVTRWRAKASMMTLRPTDKDQIRMIVRNLHTKLMQRMIVIPFPTFADLHEMGVQIEDALKQGLFDQDREQPRRTFNRNNNAGPSGAATARTSEVSVVTTIPPPLPRPMAATPFSGASGSDTQATRFQPRGQRTFTPLYMPLTKALGVLIKKNHLKPLEPRPLTNPLPPSYDPAKYCAYHQQHGHDTDRCYRLRHEIQDLIDKQVIAPPDKPNVTTNPLPPHNQAPPPRRINFIQTGVASYDPSIYITPSHLPKPEVSLPDCTDFLCMVDISTTQPEPTVVTTEDKTRQNSGENRVVESGNEQSLAGGAYNPSEYITSTNQNGLGIELPKEEELCVIQEDGFRRGADDLATIEEDFANLQFFDDQEPGDATINWFDNEESAEATGWLDDQPDIVGEPQPEQSPAGASVTAVAGRAGSQDLSPESTGAKNSARDLAIMDTGIVEKPTVLTQMERERFEETERIRKAKGPEGTESAVGTKMENAASMWTESTASAIRPEPDRYLLVASGMWWEDDDLCLAHTDEDWGSGQPDDTWYLDEVDHMTRSGRYFKPPHLDQPEASGKDKEAEKQKEKQIEEEVVLRQLKKIQADISIWGLFMASRVHRQAVLTAMDKSKLSIDTTPEQLVGLVFPGGGSPALTFSDKELPPEGINHNKPLYISVECRDKWIPVVLVDTGSAINVCPARTAYAIGLKPVDFVPTTQVIRAYDNTSREVMGTVKIQTQVGPGQHNIEFHVLDVPATFNLLLGRPWLHQAKAVSSTLHQMLKYPHGRGVAIVFGNSSIHPPPEVSKLVLEIEHGTEDVFLSGFTLAEARVVQNIMAVNKGMYVSAQSVYLMNKLQHILGMGLGKSGRKGVSALAEVPHNPHTFGLGCLPTKEDWVRKGKEMAGRARAKQAGKPFELMHRPIWGTLNGRFVREGEDFPFCGFPEPWLNAERKRVPGFEIFFDLQLPGDDVAEEQTDPSVKVEQSEKAQSEDVELEVGVALASLLSDPSIDQICLGDNSSVSMIGDETAAGLPATILDASIAPSLIWQYEEGFLSSSTGSGSEPESDSTESCESESGSSSTESESGNSGDDHPDATVKSRSSFSFSFESVVTEISDDLDELNENLVTVVSEYFSVPLIYCMNSDFQNFDENDEEEIPPVLQRLIEQDTEEDPRLLQIGSTLSSEERERLVALLKDFKDVFAWSYEDMPGINPEIVQHRIPLDPEARPVKQKLRRIRPDWALKIKEEVTKQIDAGFLQVSEYLTWLANIVPVPKKDGRVRVCVDFRDLNRASPKDDFPLPHIDELVDFTAGHALLSFMDGFSGYNQIMMAPEDREKTAFTTPWGTYCYRVMPFGLKNAGATYQRAATTILHDMIHKEVEVYVDDMIVKSKEREGHYTALQKFFQRIREFRLRLNPQKCTFGVTAGKMLGFLITQRGIEVDPSKIKAISEMPPPRTEKEVRGFLGKVQFIRRFISKLTLTCEPLFGLLKKGKKFHWDGRCQAAFEQIKEYLQNPPVLSPPEPGKPLILYLSVTETTMGCMLAQESDDKVERAIYYLSKKMLDY
ncbi:hypothetical protein HYC85_030740 [Camellia sinensis]|uniref:Reverse transcriptase domain-containing protein n=1 Tax=Camellia sinensis TaxID=4442 RepID=A0A7J7G1N0_CAMSI|nr:hypothetical protein HYC85_030740 [Camellia sinensis]